MRLLILFIAAIFCLAFDSSFGGVFTLRSMGSITPLAMPCLVVFVALFAPSMMAYIAALALGLLVDLSPGHGDLSQGIHLIGPSTLGFFVCTIFSRFQCFAWLSRLFSRFSKIPLKMYR